MKYLDRFNFFKKKKIDLSEVNFTFGSYEARSLSDVHYFRQTHKSEEFSKYEIEKIESTFGVTTSVTTREDDIYHIVDHDMRFKFENIKFGILKFKDEYFILSSGNPDSTYLICDQFEGVLQAIKDITKS